MTTLATPSSLPSETELDALTRELARPEGTVPNPRRNGKIARLPRASRDMLNRMLDDGLPYHVIIEELGEAGEGLNAQNITNWVRGGYQDYLRQQEAFDRAKAQVEFALEMVQELRDFDPATIRRACNHLATLQIFYLLFRQGDHILKKMVERRPDKYLPLLNTAARLSDSYLKLEEFRCLQQLLCGAAVPPASEPAVPPAVGSESQNPDFPIKPDQGSSSPEPKSRDLPQQPIPPMSLQAAAIKPNQGNSSPGPKSCDLQ